MSGLETYRGSVQTWECDEMGHLNVQHYMAKLEQALVHFRAVTGTARDGMLILRSACDHVRFLAELRDAELLYIETGVTGIDETGVDLWSVMRKSQGGDVAATYTSRLEAFDCAAMTSTALPSAWRERLAAITIEADPNIGPRGVPAMDIPAFDEATLLGADAVPLYRGAVLPEHLNSEGFNGLRYYLGRLSEGVMHSFFRMGIDAEAMFNDGIGNIALEQRMRYTKALTVGTPIAIYGVPVGTNGKIMNFANFMIDSSTGEGVGSFQAAAAFFDLKDRRIHPLTPEQDALIRQRARNPVDLRPVQQ